MKSELRATPHKVLAGAAVVEVWYAGELIATVTGADGPGVRVISKYALTAAAEVSGPPHAMRVAVATRPKG